MAEGTWSSRSRTNCSWLSASVKLDHLLRHVVSLDASPRGVDRAVQVAWSAGHRRRRPRFTIPRRPRRSRECASTIPAPATAPSGSGLAWKTATGKTNTTVRRSAARPRSPFRELATEGTFNACAESSFPESVPLASPKLPGMLARCSREGLQTNVVGGDKIPVVILAGEQICFSCVF